MKFIIYSFFLVIFPLKSELFSQTDSKTHRPIRQIENHSNDKLTREELKQRIANINEHIQSIDIKVAHVRSNEETHLKALQDNYYENMEKIKQSLLERRAAFIKEMESIIE